jgi:DNA mismatch repair protein MutL
MADIIQLLPDNIANQIAAGEVIQRPASVVKELVENSIDAGSTEIKIIIKDAGKTLIQVIDNGMGMSSTDARMSFERHATSKIKSTEDLFNIKTKGFRGEALASIAAIAHVDMITCTPDSDLATHIGVDESKIKKQEFIQGNIGTSISVKNLFFNVPARRKFLKSDAVELKHLLEEIHRVALAHPEVKFVVFHNGNETYHLPSGSLKQRIIGIFGKNYEDKLLPVTEEAGLTKVEGFVLKSEVAKKNSGEQYLFVNNRFIKNNYLNHAVKMAYEQLIQSDQYPGYFLFLEVDPATIDINVHPTKTEIKFDEERLIYNIIRVSVKHALGKFLIAPTLDFDMNVNYFTQQRSINLQSSNFNFQNKDNDVTKLERENLKSWQEIYKGISDQKSNTQQTQSVVLQSEIGVGNKESEFSSLSKNPYQLHNSYILCHIKNGLMIIDQYYATERILYEENLKSLKGNPKAVQRELFAQTLEVDGSTFALINSLLSQLNNLGFEIGEFGKNTFVIHGIPAELDSNTNSLSLLNEIIDTYKSNMEFQLGVDANIARSYASSAAIKKGKTLNSEEMKEIIDKLFACETPYISPGGFKTFIKYSLDDIQKQFK